MTRVFAGERTFLRPGSARRSNALIYWCCGVDEKEEQHWLTYAVAMLFFSAVGFLTLYALQRLQWYLPFNPQGQTGVAPDLAMNTSVSFVTNTNWQSLWRRNHDGLSRRRWPGSTVHNFLSAATGIAIAVGVDPRLCAARGGQDDRQFLGRSDPLHALRAAADLRSLLPCCCVWQGMPQNLGAYTERNNARRRKADRSRRVRWRRRKSIKMLGTNGGGFFNANSAHPFENPTALTNLIQMLMIFSIGAALTMYLRPHGRQTNARAGRSSAAMAVLFVAGVHGRYRPRRHGNPGLRQARRRSAAERLAAGR